MSPWIRLHCSRPRGRNLVDFDLNGCNDKIYNDIFSNISKNVIACLSFDKSQSIQSLILVVNFSLDLHPYNDLYIMIMRVLDFRYGIFLHNKCEDIMRFKMLANRIMMTNRQTDLNVLICNIPSKPFIENLNCDIQLQLHVAGS